MAVFDLDTELKESKYLLENFAVQIADCEPSLRIHYTGLLNVACVSNLERSLKNIIYDFVESKNNDLLEQIVKKRFDRLNGKLKSDDIIGNHAAYFGDDYSRQLKTNIEKIELYEPAFRHNYNNFIQGRHIYLHGSSDITQTVEEIGENIRRSGQMLQAVHDIFF